MEAWLNRLLCLDVADAVPPLPHRLPHPSQCNLFYVNRDTLFSFHQARFSYSIMSVFGSKMCSSVWAPAAAHNVEKYDDCCECRQRAM